MIVTPLHYGLENELLKKLDLMIKRLLKNKDVVLIVEGGEGEGKTNSSIAIAYYVKSKTGMPIHLFFRLEGLLELAKKTENQIFIWDEPSLDSCNNEWYTEVNKALQKMIMTCRKKRHFFIFNFVKFYKFSEYLVVERALGLIHMYSRYETQPGRFIYIRRKNLELLWNGYHSGRRRRYGDLMAFGGSFPIVEHLIGEMGITIEGHPNATKEDYETLKDRAIESIEIKPGKKNKEKEELINLKQKVGKLECPIETKEELAKQLGFDRRTLNRWAVDRDTPGLGA